MRKIKILGLLGTGVIGSGWATRALHCGFDVIAADIDPKMAVLIKRSIEATTPAFEALTQGIAMPEKGSFSFTTNPLEMAVKADFIQENVPEVLEIKRKALASLAMAAPKDVIIASSTSGFMPSELQEGMTFPERFIVGHPFNPVYLCPLVEIVAGKWTGKAALEATRGFYREIAMHPLLVRKEVPGHLSDRLQEAIWREILHALKDDIATTGELDEAIVYGPGLRWAIMGVNQIFMMAGGEGGAQQFLKQFTPALEWSWSYLKPPKLNDEIISRYVEGTSRQANGKTIREMEHIRDECLVAIQQVLRKYNVASGTTLNDFEKMMKKRKKSHSSKPG